MAKAMKSSADVADDDFVESSGNVFADLGLDNAEELLTQAALVHEIAALVAKRKLTPAQAAKLCNLTTADMRRLLAFDPDEFSTHQLMHVLTCFGRDVDIVIRARVRKSDPK